MTSAEHQGPPGARIHVTVGLVFAGVVGGLLLAALPEGGGPSEKAMAPAHPVHAPTARIEFLPGPIQPIPLHQDLDTPRALLGRDLFFDPILSRDFSISCSSCHDLANGGDDGRTVSIGAGGVQGNLNAPTVLNSGLNSHQFWDGRAKTLEEQVDGPLLHPDEMGMTWEEVTARLADSQEYAERFLSVYGEPVAPEHVRDAIATFERALLTPDSPFDRFLRGDPQAISAEARKGWDLFQVVGCTTCHQGVNAGGNMFQRMGIEADYFDEEEALDPSSLGRFNVTGDERDRYRFKVPSLRNVALTAPYFHDGSAATLEEAVEAMAYHQIGEELAPEETTAIVAFLESLTGELPAIAVRDGAKR